MNFFSGQLMREDGKLTVDCGAFKVEVPADRTNVYPPEVGKPVIFGIRPEDIDNPRIRAIPALSPQPVPATVDVTELMGNEIFVYLKSGDHSYVARSTRAPITRSAKK